MDKSDSIDLLFTADTQYVRHIPVVLLSLFENDPGVAYHIHLIHDDLCKSEEEELTGFCKNLGYGFSSYKVDKKMFSTAPVNKHYSPAMYYRHLAFHILPPDIKKALYLDPDTLIINPLHPLWETDMEGHLFLAASHTERQEGLNALNHLRLKTTTPYFNTGVMVMDLEGCRSKVSEQDFYAYIREKGYMLLLPDQDVFNALYGSQTKAVPDEIWNYDVRKYTQYLLRSGGVYDERWVLENTVVLHYCGKTKPWGKSRIHRLGFLYLHYVTKTRRIQPDRNR